MEKRVIFAVVLCVGILFAWGQLFPPPTPPPVQQQAQTPGDKGASPSGATPGSETKPSAAPQGAGGAAAEAPSAPQPEKLITLETAAVRFVFSSYGGTLRQAQLREEKYLQHKADPTSGLNLVSTGSPELAPLKTSFPDSGFKTPADNAWQVASSGPDSVVFRAEDQNVLVEKRYRTDPARYRVQLDVVVRNKTTKAQDHHLALHVFGRQDPEKKDSGILSGPASNIASIVCRLGDETVRKSVEDLAKEPFDKVGNVRWIAADEKFFMTAAVPFPESPPRERKCKGTTAAPGVGEGVVSFAGRTVQPGQESSYSFAVFAGPKVISELTEVRPAGQDVELAESVDVTLAILSRPILSLLKVFHSFAHNWGLAIILLTIFIKLVTFYPTQRSLVSAKRMQRLAPKMAAIRKKYENDRQRQSVETMNLYKAHGVSPLGGCLPSLIQMPIWIALYSTLNYAVELYRSPFLGYIHDLTAKDPYYLTPLLMGLVMFLQMKMSPASPDKQQQAIMTVMMPVMFTGFSLFLPAGLALYMLTSYLIGIVQQLYVNWLDRKGKLA